MDRLHDHYPSYSWHQATVLLLVPYDTLGEDVDVIIERNNLVAGVHGQSPIVKGRLYGNVDTTTSTWQLEPRVSRHLSARERTTSTTSTASSSYTFVSDPEISSSFAASLENGLISDADDPAPPLPHYLHPYRPSSSHPPASLTSSLSSIESLRTSTGRLLTLHLEKAESIIWPSLIIGPASENLSFPEFTAYPWTPSPSECMYNMDPTSMVLIALELYDIRNAYEEAFEYFVRAWHQGRIPSATIRLVTHYLPVQTIYPDLASPTPSPIPASASSSQTEVADPPAVPDPPTPDSTTPVPVTATTPPLPPTPGTPAYYLNRIGGAPGLAQLFLAAGLLHLEGTATPLLSSAYAGLSSLRAPAPPHSSTGSTDAWRRDRDAARRYFERARLLVPALDVPLLPLDADSDADSGAESGDRRSTASGEAHAPPPDSEVRRARAPPRRRKKEARELSSSFVGGYRAGAGEEDDRTWYLYIPGLVGAGTALLVVGFLSFSSWRKSQGS
ncbi:hypothetical protein B0H21DRAFT_833840 [Amylocystis lapponica]|nr:hypothetical protein B0H21DRAFT_833840 [Amylocystis lapponica]